MQIRKSLHIFVLISLLISSTFTPVMAREPQALKRNQSDEHFRSAITAPLAPAATTYYVDEDAVGAATGISWTDAYTNVQDALTTAISGTEIYVAEGLYYPDEGAGQVNDDRESTFELVEGVSLYGGFDPGSGADEFSERDWETYLTVLSGDLEQNDITDPTGVVTEVVNIVGHNAWTVVTSIGVTETTMLDGFTINAGRSGWSGNENNPSQSGGGFYNLAGSPRLSNMRFLANDASSCGAGIYNQEGSVYLSTVIFENNWGSRGSAIANQDGILNLSDITISNNHGEGGIYNHSLSKIATISITQSIFSENATIGSGGAIYNFGEGDIAEVHVSYSVFDHNYSRHDGGGIYNLSETGGTAKVQVVESTFSNNQADIYAGGGIFSDSRGGVSQVDVFDSTFVDNIAFWGGGIAALTDGNYSASVSVFNSTFSSNTGITDGGAILNSGSTNMLVENSTFDANVASLGGAIENGGYRDYNTPSLIVINSTFFGNAVQGNTVYQDGGAILNVSSTGGVAHLEVINSTFANNTADDTGGAISNIIWDSTATSVLTMTGSILASSPSGGDCYNNSLPIIDGGHNLVEDGTCGFPVGGDPMLSSLADNGGDTLTQALLPGSPAIDAIPVDECAVTTDQRGVSRPQGSGCDIGAYEANIDVYAGSDQTVDEGGLVQLQGTVGDPFAALYYWDFGDGAAATDTLTPTHTYLDDRVYTVTLTVTDTHGGVASDWLLVTVENVSPTLSAFPDQETFVAETITVTGTITDPGILDSQTILVTWADGLSETLHLNATERQFTLTHAYAQPGEYAVTVRVTDKDGGWDEQSFSVIFETKPTRIFLPLVTR